MGGDFGRVNYIINCKNRGLVKSTKESDSDGCTSGGIAGYLCDSEIEGCVNDGNVDGLALDVGGIAGFAKGMTIIGNSSNYGEIRR